MSKYEPCPKCGISHKHPKCPTPLTSPSPSLLADLTRIRREIFALWNHPANTEKAQAHMDAARESLQAASVAVECYWHFNQDHMPKIPPATEKHALPWRKSFQDAGAHAPGDTEMKLKSFTGSNATHCSPSSTLTPDILEECRKMLANPPLPRADHFVSPRAMEALRRESTPSADSISRMLGMDVFVMEDQKADAWVITDPHIAAAYRKGEISEDALKRMSDRIAEIRASQENVEVARTEGEKRS